MLLFLIKSPGRAVYHGKTHHAACTGRAWRRANAPVSFSFRGIRNEFRAIDPGIVYHLLACAAITAARRLFTRQKVECDCVPKVWLCPRDNRSLSIKLMARVTSVKVVRSLPDERFRWLRELSLERSNLVSTRATFNFPAPLRFIERGDLRSGRGRSADVYACG